MSGSEEEPARRLDQLLYTWAEYGLQGRSRFQVVAASRGFLDDAGEFLRTALQVCDYRAPREARDDPPVSFGWLDRDGTRFLFNRVDAGTDGFGRRGNFVAHVVAGPASAMPTHETVTTFGSPFWRRDVVGLDPDVALGRLSLSDVPRRPRTSLPSRSTVEAFLTALVAARRADEQLIAMICPDDLIALMAHAVDVLPRPVLADVTMSTFEPTSTAAWFDVVGVAPEARVGGWTFTMNGGGPWDDEQVRLVVQRLLSTDSAVRAVPEAAAAAAGTSTSAGCRFDVSLWLTTIALFESIERCEEVPPEAAALVLRAPAAGAELLSMPAGRDAVATALLDGDNAMWEAFTSTAPTVDAAVLHSVAGAVARQWAERARARASCRTVAATTGVAPEFDGALLDYVLTLVGRFGLAGTLDAPSRIALLARAAASDYDPPVVREILSVPTDQLSEVVSHGSVPFEFRAAALTTALLGVGGERVERIAAEAFMAEPELAVHVARAPSPGLEATFDFLPDGVAIDVARRAAGRPDTDPAARDRLLALAAARLPPSDRLAFVARTALRQHGRLNANRWEHLVVSAVSANVDAALSEATSKPGLDATAKQALAAVDGHGDVAAWETLGDVVHRLRSSVRSTLVGFLVDEARAAIERLSDPTQQASANHLLFDAATPHAASYEHFVELIRVLRIDRPSHPEHEALTCLLVGTRNHRHPSRGRQAASYTLLRAAELCGGSRRRDRRRPATSPVVVEAVTRCAAPLSDQDRGNLVRDASEHFGQAAGHWLAAAVGPPRERRWRR